MEDQEVIPKGCVENMCGDIEVPLPKGMHIEKGTRKHVGFRVEGAWAFGCGGSGLGFQVWDLGLRHVGAGGHYMAAHETQGYVRLRVRPRGISGLHGLRVANLALATL